VTPPSDNSAPVLSVDNSIPVVTPPSDNSIPVVTPPSDNSAPVLSVDNSIPVVTPPSDNSIPVVTPPSDNSAPVLPVDNSITVLTPPSDSSIPVVTPVDNSTPVVTSVNNSTVATPEVISSTALETPVVEAEVVTPTRMFAHRGGDRKPSPEVSILPGVAPQESAPVSSTPEVVVEQPNIDIIELPRKVTVASPVGVAAANLDLAEYEVSLSTNKLGFAANTSIPNFAPNGFLQGNGLLAGLAMLDMADDDEILIVENNWEVDVVAAASLVNLSDAKTVGNNWFLANSNGGELSVAMNGNGTGQVLSTSDSYLVAKPDLNMAFQSGDVQEIVWNIEKTHNQEFENYLGVSAELGRQGVATSSFQLSLKKMESETGQRAAILYAVALADGLELVVVPPEGKPWRYSVPEADRNTLLAMVQMLRDRITDPRQRFTNSYLAPAQQLYRWLIAPIEADLEKHQIATLLFSMDAGLRSLPVAALHDGEKFLVEKYNFSLIPSFSLTSQDYQSLAGAPLLAMGASNFNQQQPLPAVPVELMAITQEMGAAKSFLNADFTLSNLNSQRAKGQFPIIHLATHAEFLPGAPSNSYIQLWDEQLSLDKIPSLNWRNPQVELLVLSACRTALGDREAELGFAGLAVKAGVKSAIASLWYVSDEGSLGLMADFYGHLRQNPLKAEALRQAQLDMIRGNIRIENRHLVGIPSGSIPLPPSLGDVPNRLLQHPYYWAAFTTIGSPW
ncbi:MAG TPA: CHAT domain-containing protein, partial [Oscillatoriaceae cyanobacterium M33_DOE_052]|nr:CHAT domain-containing protein [Oscillatoriaceae cyanobacterium M33_DOE_052]